MNCIECGGKFVEVSVNIVMEMPYGKNSDKTVRFLVNGISFRECLGRGQKLFSPDEAELIEKKFKKVVASGSSM